MFLGVVPKECIQQMIEVCDFGSWPEVYTCCSGTFRIERACLARWPTLPVHANDVSLFSCALGRLIVGETSGIRFAGELAFVEGVVGADAPELDRVAAVVTALGMARFHQGARTRYKQHHIDHLRATFPADLARSRKRVEAFVDETPLAGFGARDWRDHAREAMAKGSGVAAFPPFWRGGYEKMFEFLDANVEWRKAPYEIYDPRSLEAFVGEIETQSDVPYYILSDQRFESRDPDFLFQAGGLSLPHYGYTRARRASLRHLRPAASSVKPFSFKRIDPALVTAKSVVMCIPASNAQINYLRDLYLTAA